MIHASGVTVTLSERRILSGVSFDIAEGQSVAFVGPNGSGKTTLFRCLLGLVPFHGTIRVRGFDVATDGLRARERMAYLPQRAAFGDVTAREAVSFVARLRGLPSARASPLLERVGLSSHADRRVREFSGGMAQRLSLAVAMLSDAPLMILDEPTASLDRDAQSLFLTFATRWKKEGRTLLLSSHRAEEVQHLADRVVTLHEGQVALVASEPHPIPAPAQRVLQALA